jgi:hypothetical protein
MWSLKLRGLNKGKREETFMMNETEHGGEIVPRSTPVETGLDTATILSSFAPWIGGPVSAVLSGMSLGRKMGRINEVLAQMTKRLRNVESQSSKDYVRTDGFAELLERTLRLATDERNDHKRRVYAQFLVSAIQSPGEPYDEQVRFLQTLEQLQADHLRVLKALSSPPEGGRGVAGSPRQTLSGRLPDMRQDRISDLVSQLNDMRLTNMASLNTMMTFSGAQDLRGSITPYGERFVAFLTKTEDM